jgi:coenzyme F420-reducing hydrogenase delta subunit
MNDFEPKIMAFVCNWCPNVATDTTEVSQVTQDTNVKEIRVFCSGMVDPSYVFKAFANGADGVLITGCHPGDCHYISGNIKARGRFLLLNKLLSQLGVEHERFRLEWIGAYDSHRYMRIIHQMRDEIRSLGPLSVEP